MKRNILVVITSLLIFNTIVAQNEDTHTKAVIELFTVMDMEKVLSETISTMLDAQIASNPAIGKYKGAMEGFFQKYMSFDALKNDFVSIYKEEFSEKEIRDIIAFYKTETGKKTLKSFPLLMQKGAALGQKRVQENMEELNTLIQNVDAQDTSK